jgi:hypothetical protein
MTENTPFCPECESEIEPSDDDRRAAIYCRRHMPPAVGVDDGAVNIETYPAGTTEAGGEDNRNWCDFFHRRRVRRRSL